MSAMHYTLLLACEAFLCVTVSSTAHSTLPFSSLSLITHRATVTILLIPTAKHQPLHEECDTDPITHTHTQHTRTHTLS